MLFSHQTLYLDSFVAYLQLLSTFSELKPSSVFLKLTNVCVMSLTFKMSELGLTGEILLNSTVCALCCSQSGQGVAGVSKNVGLSPSLPALLARDEGGGRKEIFRELAVTKSFFFGLFVFCCF